jgi:AraC family transcriptional regulator, positive regulator of tynA and feaB
LVLGVENEAIRRWRTRDVPEANRLDYFAAALGEAINFPFSVDNADPSTFDTEVGFAHLDAIGVCKMAGSPHRSFRGPSEIARTREHKVNLIMTLDCSWSAEHRTRVQMSPRDILVHDSHLPICSDIRNVFNGISVAVTEGWLRRWLPNPSVFVARRIAGASPWGHALSSYLAELSPELVAAPPLPLAVLADQVGGLLALTASVLRGGAAPEYTPATRSLHERVLDCIRQRCTESQLTAADVGVSLNISLRTLHRTLAAASETFGAKLIEARVRVAERMLGSPLFSRVTTAEIGRRSGFSSASHFARVMRRHTGRTPLQLRRSDPRAR